MPGHGGDPTKRVPGLDVAPADSAGTGKRAAWPLRRHRFRPVSDQATELRSAPFSGRTAWARNLETPLRSFLRTETGSAAVLLAATVAALVWVNVDSSSYERVWG